MGSGQMRFEIPQEVDLALLCGPQDCVLRRIEERIDATVGLHDGSFTVAGRDVDPRVVSALVDDLFEMAKKGKAPTPDDVDRSYDILTTSDYSPNSLRDDILLTYRGRAIRPKTSGQKRYCDAIRDNTITFGIGPAGTGKTYLAMAMAIAALKRKEIGRIILTRPVVEAGENLGFLPGTLDDKVDPYVRPLYDALFDMTDMEKGNQLISQGVIEIAPLAFMRGRTFNDAFIILDEAQNTTSEQLKMFLTRLGFGSKMVITGDVTQIDLAHGTSGLLGAEAILGDIDEISFIELTGKDVVRHSLVARIVSAYEKAVRGVQQSIEGL